MSIATSADRPLAAAASELLQVGLAAADAYGRDDLADRLGARRRRLHDPDLALMIIGEFKQGKSTLVNALLNVAICPVDDDIATAVPTAVRHGDTPTAQAVFQPRDNGDETAPARHAEDISLDAVPAYVTNSIDLGGRVLQSVELTVPRRLLASGLAIVDTPGVGGLESCHGAAAMGSLPAAEAMLFVTDASQPLTPSELAFLSRAVELCPRLAVILTKIDLYPQWRQIAELDEGLLVEAGIDAPLLPVSSLLRQRAVETGEQDLNAESGYPTLVEWLRTDVLAQADRIAAQGTGRDVADVCDQLRLQFGAEKQALTDPARVEALVADLERAERRAEHLQTGAARWQTALNDGVQDLNSDVDHDLRARFRDVSAEADARIDGGEPLDIWDEFEPWVRQYVAEQVAGNHAFLTERAEELSHHITELFTEEEEALGIGAIVFSPLSVVRAVEAETKLDRSGKVTIIGSTLGVLRGGYGGMLMFGMLAGMAGLTLATPVSLAIGLAMGTKQHRDEKKRQLTQRRQQAKQTYRKYTDAVSFAVSKESRDTMRRVHREIRDGWSERAQELQRSTQEALQAAQRAAQPATAGREARLADIDAELTRIEALHSAARQLEARAER